MSRKTILVLFSIFLVATAAHAGQLTVTGFSTHSIAQPDQPPLAPFTSRAAALALPAVYSDETPTLLAFPVAGTIGQDLSILYHVDLDPSPAVLDFNCTHQTFDGHNGNDPYVASFRQQDIGVPVFAALDGVVIAAHGGEFDRNTQSNPLAPLNTVSIQHSGTQVTRYDHLRQDVLVKVGDKVTAGQQIGWIGSSGQSPAPHLHFQADVNGQSFEPFAGPCRPGPSYWSVQPAISKDPIVIGAALSSTSFDNVPYPPQDAVTRTGTFGTGGHTVYMQLTMGHITSGSSYTITLQRPDGTTMAVNGPLTENRADLLSVRWGLNAYFDTPGVWNALVDVNGTRIARLPFTVSSSISDFVNHAPNALNATIDPLNSAEVAVCHSGSPFVADPDYDVVSYHYEWTVNGVVVRSVTSAARTDDLARQYTVPGASISCAVTASDGTLQTATSTAYATSTVEGRRRAVGR